MKHDNDLFYSVNSNRTVFKYNLEKQTFLLDSLLTNTFYFDNNNNIIGSLISEPISNKIWGFSERNIICLSQGKFNKKPQEIKIPVSNAFRRGLGVSTYENITYLEEDIFLIGVSNGYVILDLNKFKPINDEIGLRSLAVS